MRYAVLDLTAPLVSWGAPRIDDLGPTDRLPGLSAITGMVANALGLERVQGETIDALQASISYAAREDRVGGLSVDFQTAKIGASDKGWTRSGVDTRRGGANTYDNPKIMRRFFLEDQHVVAVLSVSDGPFTLDEVIAGLRKPARPLFFGRKPFLPTRPIFAGEVMATDALAALRAVDYRGEGWPEPGAAVWPDEIGGGARKEVRDLKNWKIGTHTGVRYVREGSLTATMPL